jgi:hypothetical protein
LQISGASELNPSLTEYSLMTLPFHIQLAWYALRGCPSSILKWMAIDLINRGFEAPELDELAWEPAGRQAEALFATAAKRIGLAVPTRDEAIAILLRYYIDRMSKPEFDALAELQEMMSEVCRGWEMKAYTQAHDVAAFVTANQAHEGLMKTAEGGDSASYNGLTGDAALAALGEEVRKIAEEWLGRHAPPVAAS